MSGPWTPAPRHWNVELRGSSLAILERNGAVYVVSSLAKNLRSQSQQSEHQPHERRQPMTTIAKPTFALALTLLVALCAPATTRAQTADGPRGLNGLPEV